MLSTGEHCVWARNLKKDLMPFFQACPKPRGPQELLLQKAQTWRLEGEPDKIC